MKVKTWKDGVKAIIIELADIFFNMGVDEVPEDYPEEKEKEAHIKTISEVLRQAKEEGYKKYNLLTREEAEAKGQDLGLNGIYLVVLRR